MKDKKINNEPYIQLYKTVCECIDSEGKIEKDYFIEIIKEEFQVIELQNKQNVICIENHDANKCDM